MSGAGASSAPRGTPLRAGVAAAVFSLTSLAFLPVLRNGFVNWDDPGDIVHNAHLARLSWTNLDWMFTDLRGVYAPLSWLSLALDRALWGLDPAGFHLTSLLLHALNAVLVYRLALKLLGWASQAEPGRLHAAAAAAALAFSLHPLRVESVAWATERRDVLCGSFFLLALLAYVPEPGDAGPARRAPWLYLASLLSKASGMCLAPALAALDVYPLRRLPGDPRRWGEPACRAVWREKVPYLVLGLCAAAVAGYAQRRAGAAAPIAYLGWGQRLLLCLHSVGFYAGKTLLPWGLSPFYSFPRAVAWSEPRLARAAAGAAALTALLFLQRRRWPAAATAWLCYLFLLAPVSGVFQSNHELAADRYTYLPCLGAALLAGGLLLGGDMRRRLPAGAALLTLLGAATWRQCLVWRDDAGFVARVLAVEPASPFGNNNMGVLLARQGRLAEARARFEAAVAGDPDDASARYNLQKARALAPAASR